MANVVRYLTGFEGWPSGTISASGAGLSSGITGTPTVGATYKRSGVNGVQVNPVAAADESWNTPVLTGQAVAAASCWVKPVTVTSATVYEVFAIVGTSGVRVGVGIDASGNWMVRDSNSGTVTATGAAVVTGAFVLVELLVDMHANPWTVKWRIGGADQATPTNVAVAASTFSKLGMGAFGTGNRTVELYFDDIMVIDGTDQTMWPLGGFDIEGVTADQAAAASHVGATLTGWAYTDNNFTGTTGITTNAETASRSRVNVLGDANHGVQNSSASPAGNLQYPIADPANTGVPRAVAAIAACKESGTGTNNATFRTLLSASSTNIFSGNPGTTAPWNTFSGTTLGYLLKVMDVAPDAAAWTLQKTKDMLFEFLSTDGNPNPRLMGFGYELAFPSPSGNTYTKAGYAVENAVA